ncbi:restriction endonuclease subunit S [Pseudomonas sp.]|uniref:restriction endonuclease subunit S n=1 Tax=Pseudomonas sp. TaxID=306 RepID=UPI003242EC5E
MSDLKKIGITDDTFRFTTVEQLVADGVLYRPMDGNHGEQHPKVADYVSDGIPFIMANDLSQGRIDYDYCSYIAKKQADGLRKGFAKPGDVLVTHKATIGRTALVGDEANPYIMLTPQVTYYRIKNPKVLDKRYLRHYFDSSLFQQTLSMWAGAGATRAYLGITGQGKLPVVVPPRHKQRKIAAILTAYDDLIEVNKRRIALLEKMAEGLYREWFVRLRFPGYQNTRFVKGVPEGWDIKPISTLCAEIRAGVKRKDLGDEEIYVGLEHIPRKSISFKEWATADSIDSNKLRFEERDILFSMIRPYLHKVALAHFSGACSSDTIVLRSRKGHYEGFLLFTVFSDTFIELATVASKGTKMPRADWAFLEKLELKIPPSHLLEAFQKKFEELFSLITALLQTNRNAAKTRDLLLPRLISGKLSVEDLDIQFPPSMQEGSAEQESLAEARHA